MSIQYKLMKNEIKSSKNYGKYYPKTAKAYGNIGAGYSFKGNYEKALEYYQTDLERSIKIFGENHRLK